MTAATLKKQMAAKRAVKCKTPGGFEVVIRPPNIEQHALAGGLPARLRSMAQKGVKAIDEAVQEAMDGDAELLTYLDGIVARMFVEPSFDPPIYELVNAGTDDEPKMETVLKSGDKLDDYLLPADYKWALLVAFGEEDHDGEGKRLWGREPLSRFARFRDKHGCAEDCPRCQAVLDSLSMG